jgi:predicted transcriptional regulator of viral defense system
MKQKNENLVKSKTIITPRDISIFKNTKRNYSSLVLERLEKKGIIRRLKKGKYTTSYDIYSIATNLIFPSYISFWSAISYKGKTEQILNTIFVACTKKTRDIEFEKYKIKFIKLPKNNFFGFNKEVSGKEEIFIADNEKIVIDCLMFPRYSGNLDEVIKFIENSDFDLTKLKNYLKMINQTSLTQKIGFLLEKYKNLDIGISIKTRNYVSMTLSTNEKINKKWKVKIR